MNLKVIDTEFSVSKVEDYLRIDLNEEYVFLTICQRKVTSCHFRGNGTLVARSRVRAKELSKVISNNNV